MIIRLRDRSIQADVVVDVKHVPELAAGISRDRDRLVIGANTVMTDIAADETIRSRFTALAEAAIVVGSRNSSNSLRLVEVAERAGCKRAMLVDRASEIDWTSLEGIRSLGVSAGASAPEALVDEVIEAFAQRYDIKVTASGAQRESIVFNLPRDLRTAPAA